MHPEASKLKGMRQRCYAEDERTINPRISSCCILDGFIPRNTEHPHQTPLNSDNDPCNKQVQEIPRTDRGKHQEWLYSNQQELPHDWATLLTHGSIDGATARPCLWLRCVKLPLPYLPSKKHRIGDCRIRCLADKSDR